MQRQERSIRDASECTVYVIAFGNVHSHGGYPIAERVKLTKSTCPQNVWLQLQVCPPSAEEAQVPGVQSGHEGPSTD